MMVSVIKWRSRPPPRPRKFAASITLRCLKGLLEIGGAPPSPEGGSPRVAVEIRWKGSKGIGLKALSRTVKVNRTRRETVGQNGVVRWDEEFRSVCSFSGYGDNGGCFNPWEVAFIFFNGLIFEGAFGTMDSATQGWTGTTEKLFGEIMDRHKIVIMDRSALTPAQPVLSRAIPFRLLTTKYTLMASDGQPKKRLVAGAAILDLAEFASVDDEQQLEIIVPHILSNGVECNLSLFLNLKLTEVSTDDESSEAILISSTMPSSLKKSLGKVKSLTEFVSPGRRPRKGDGKVSTGSENSDSNCPSDTDSLDENKEDFVEDLFGYGDLVSANLAGGVFDLKRSVEDEDLVYYSNRRPKVDDSSYGDYVPEQTLKLSPKIGILRWKKRKLSFRSARVRGEPLLKKEYGESGGDDIDHDRRRLSSSDESSSFEQCKTEEESLSISEFGNDRFTVGSWETKEIASRDGSMELQTQVFFASIDQRHEKAGGESACTPLVIVIAHWLHTNRPSTPTTSEFDALIAQGSLHWRNLCALPALIARFPNKHFDLDTVLNAGIRPLTVVAQKSFIGFFRPEGMEDNEDLGFLHGALSFDDIWDEIGRSEPSIYIVSWNDHFFTLKVEADAYYVIDTLGERLEEGCEEAYVLKFDKDTRIWGEEREEERGGKEVCREYIKRFMAGIAVREVEGDVKKGRVGAAPLHHRLQIDFHHTQLHVVGD